MSVLPSILAVTVPLAFLLGLVMGLRALGGSIPPQKWLAPATGLSIAVAVGMFVLCGWIVPVGNQSVREVVTRVLAPSADAPPRVRGVRELTFPELRAHIVDARRDGPVAPVIALEWHKKLVIPLFCACLGPLAVALTRPRAGRSPSAARSLTFAALPLAFFFAAARQGERAVRNGRASPAAGAWAAMLVPALCVLAARGRRDDGSYSFRNELEG